MAHYYDEESDVLGLPPSLRDNFMISTPLEGASQYEDHYEQENLRPYARIGDNVVEQRNEGIVAVRDYQHRFRAVVDAFKEHIEYNEVLQKQLKKLFVEAKALEEKHGSPRSIHQRICIDSSSLEGLQSRLMKQKPMIALPALEAAVNEYWNFTILAEDAYKHEIAPPRVGMLGWMGSHHVTPRGLTSALLDKLVCIEGVVNKCSSVNPKLTESIYVRETPADSGKVERSVHIRQHYDITDLDKTARDAGRPPANDPEGKTVNRLEVGLSRYRNHQKFIVQETPETAPTGQLPRWADVIVEDELCDLVKCGDRVRIWGVYRMHGGRATSDSTGSGRPYLIADNIQKRDQMRENSGLSFTENDVANFMAFGKRTDALDVLCRSFAPSICGLEMIKKGLVLLLLGGTEKILESSHHIRGDIHMLLVGDPSCGKSQLLRYVLDIFPGSVSATGRGSSGVGLTAAVITDQETGERRVEGGAMVLADRHVICIDEFDKMQKTDRVAIHEVMEQQTVTVAKAGIHTTLNARCSILAAANPVAGCWSDDADLRRQLNFEDSLLSRFDLIYIIKDSSSEADDDRIAESVLKNVSTKASPVIHEARRGINDSIVQADPDMYQANANLDGSLILRDTTIFNARHVMVYMDREGIEHEILTQDFLKKYLSFAKNHFFQQQAESLGWSPHPELSDEAETAVISFFVEMRERVANASHTTVQTVTTRSLEAIVRLSTAHAKLRLKRWVTKEDVKVAKELLLFCFFGEELMDVFSEDGDSVGSTASAEVEDFEDFEDEEYTLSSKRKAAAAAKASKGQNEAAGGSRNLRRSVREITQEISKLTLEGGRGKRLRLQKEDEGTGLDENTQAENLPAGVQFLTARQNSVLLQLIVEVFSVSGNENGLSVNDLFQSVIGPDNAPVKISKELFTNWLSLISESDSPPLLYFDDTVYPC